MKKIFVVEDDDNIREIVCYALKTAGFEALEFPEPAPFWRALHQDVPALVILDIMLPEEDGLSILNKLKAAEKTRKLPVIMLTAKGAEYDRIKGLDLGAEDYVTKPFSVMELISRVKAVLRRWDEDDAKSLTLGAVSISSERRAVSVNGQGVQTTYTEFELLYCLMRNAGIVLSRDRLSEKIWGVDGSFESRAIDMHIKALRQKLGSGGGQIKTVRSVGYKMEAEI